MSTWQGNVLRGDRASQPAAASVVVGCLYCVTDEGFIVERSTGAAWEEYSPTVSGSGDVVASGTLTSGQLVIGDGGTNIDVTTTGTGIVTALGVNVGSAGAPVVNGGVLGTPSSGTLTNCTGLPTAGLVNAAVTLAKIQNASANSKLLGSGAAGSGASYAELTLGTGLSMSGTTLNASGGVSFGFTAPVDGDFAWVNQGGASTTVSTVWGGTAVYLLSPATTGPNLRIRKKAAPATPYTVTAAILPQMLNIASQAVGLCFRQASDGKVVVFTADTGSSTGQLSVYNFNSATSFNASVVTYPTFWAGGGMLWLRIADNGTNRICSYSLDGQNFVAISTVGNTSFLTADEVGFFVNEQSNTMAAAMTLLSWAEA